MSIERDVRPRTAVHARRLPAVVLFLLTAPIAATLIVLRRDFEIEAGALTWLASTCLVFAAATWSALRIWRPTEMLSATPQGIALPEILREQLAWADIRRIQAITHRGRTGDVADRLIIHLKQPMMLNFRPPKLRKIFAGLPQSAVGIDIGLRWPVRADVLRNSLKEAAADFAAGNHPQSDTVPHTAKRWPGVIAMLAATALPIAVQVLDVGPPRLFSEALALYAKGDMRQAAPLLEQDARAGDAAAAVALGKLYLNGDGVERNPAMAAAWFERAAKRGDGAAAYHLGDAYRLGLGVLADLAAAVGWYETAADRGSPEAAFALSRLYRLGDGVRRDYNRAIDWLNVAVGMDSAPAMHDLGQLYHEGLGVPRDPETAKDWYRRAADAGLIAARYDLARLMLDGPAEQRQHGLRYLAEAAEHGYAPAQRRLAAAFVSGQGLERDMIAAYKWISLAERAWPPATRADLVREKARIQSHMGAEDIADATEQIRKWRPLRSKN